MKRETMCRKQIRGHYPLKISADRVGTKKTQRFPCLILVALKPKTKSSASIVLDLPEPFGPTIAEKDYRGTVGRVRMVVSRSMS